MQSRPGATKPSALGLCHAALEQCYLKLQSGGLKVYNCQGHGGLTVYEGDECTLYLVLWAEPAIEGLSHQGSRGWDHWTPGVANCLPSGWKP